MNIENCIEDMTQAVTKGGQLAFRMRNEAQVLSEEALEMGIVKKWEKKVDVSFLVQQTILRILRERNSVCGVLCREKDDESAPLEGDFSHKGKLIDGGYTLIVSPIDGKKNYTEPETETAPNYATCVHLAKGREVIAGAMHFPDPELNATVTTLRGSGTFIDGQRVKIEDDTDFSFDNLVRAHTLNDGIEGLFSNNPYPRAASVVLLNLLRQKMKAYLVGGVTVINFGSAQTAYEEAGGVVRDFNGQPMQSSDLMIEANKRLILQGFIGMAPSDKYYKEMLDEIRRKIS